MANLVSKLGNWTTFAWRYLLQVDNHVLGLVICVFAIFDWLTVYDGFEVFQAYFSQGLYTLPSLSILNTFFSAIYLTGAAIILLSLRPPISRYETVFPNLIAPLAAFAVYAFIFVPGGNLVHTSAVIALLLITSGAAIVIVTLVYLRQAFTVTPQARFLVTAGPYAIVRHPMYIGNILSIFGIALLIDSIEAMALFVICALLQIGRAFYEESLLRANFPAYVEYQAHVGRFFPRLPFLQPRSAASGLCCLCIPLIVPATETQAFDETSRPSIVFVATTSKQCNGWLTKANSGALYSAEELSQFELDSRESTAPSCKKFYELMDACQKISEEHANNTIGDTEFVTRVENTRGCASILATNVCQTLKGLAKNGPRLSDSRQALMANCLRVEVINRRFEKIRPGM